MSANGTCPQTGLPKPDTSYNEVIEDTPVLVTSTTTKSRLLGENYPFRYVMSYMVKVKTMGTASYVALGNEQAQVARLTIAGAYFGYQCNRYEVIDLTKKYMISDTTDAVLEVSASFLPVNQYGRVKKV